MRVWALHVGWVTSDLLVSRKPGWSVVKQIRNHKYMWLINGFVFPFHIPWQPDQSVGLGSCLDIRGACNDWALGVRKWHYGTAMAGTL